MNTGLPVGRRDHGVSLPELIIVVAVIGILAAIAIPSISGVRTAASETVSRDAVELANRAVQQYSQSVGTITVAAAGGGTDEAAVIALLKTRDPSVPGTPFLDATFPATTDGDSSKYRMTWNGANFEVVLPGDTGVGILLNTD